MLSAARNCLNFMFLAPSSFWSRWHPTYRLTTLGVSLGGRGDKTPTHPEEGSSSFWRPAHHPLGGAGAIEISPSCPASTEHITSQNGYIQKYSIRKQVGKTHNVRRLLGVEQFGEESLRGHMREYTLHSMHDFHRRELLLHHPGWVT
jgi:hypothetical protein